MASPGFVSGVCCWKSHSGAKPRCCADNAGGVERLDLAPGIDAYGRGVMQMLTSRVSLPKWSTKRTSSLAPSTLMAQRWTVCVLPLARHQPQPLQRVLDRRVVAVLGSVGDLEPHVRSLQWKR